MFNSHNMDDIWKHLLECAVRNFLEEHKEEHANDPIILDGEACFDDFNYLWVQHAHNSKCRFVLVDLNGEIVMRPYPLAFYPYNCAQPVQ